MTKTSVPLLDLKRLDPELEAEFTAAFQRVMKSGYFILGPEVKALEEECAEYCGAKHAIGVSSGTDALLLALMTLGIGPGDEVICPSYTFFATAGCVWRTGARPVFVDSLPATFNCDPADIERKVTPKTKAIIPVHLFGQCAEMDPILAVAAKHDLAVIEDAAQAIGSEYDGRRAGSLGTFGCFSFFPSKNLGAFGDGGLVTTNDDDLAEQARVLRVHGGKPKYHHRVVGGNFRLDALQAALVRPRLRRLDGATQGRQENAALYTKLFLESGLAAIAPTDAEIVAGSASMPSNVAITLPPVCQSRHIYNQYVIRIHGEGKRDALRDFLREREIGNEVYYPVPLHMQDCFSELECSTGDFPVANLAALETMAVPIFPELTTEEIGCVVDAIVEFCR